MVVFHLLAKLLFKKPVYSFPINKQFEQWMNAAYIEKLGYGKHCNSLNADDLKAFLEVLMRMKGI
jgi:UDP:flavonoid glycosyltransferase YjiC (YdhE family)